MTAAKFPHKEIAQIESWHGKPGLAGTDYSFASLAAKYYTIRLILLPLENS